MNSHIKNILDKCNDAYSRGEFYTLTIQDVGILRTLMHVLVEADEVTDQMYDVLYATAKEMWPEDEYFKKLTSENVGYGVDVIHEIPMGSMEELKEGDFIKWSKNHKDFMISDKLDGCSLILTYEDGKLKIAATRGHGTKGKDVTRHINFVPNIPKTIKYPDKIIIRGELLFKKSDINNIMDRVELLTGKRPKSGRNTISGLLTRKESFEELLKQTNFIAYWTSTNQGLSFDVLKNFGFEVPFYQKMSKETLTDENMIDLVKTRINHSDYELDGIILTQIDNSEDGFVSGTINPKCSRKFKLGIYNNEAESVVTNINWQISRWGIFTPVLEIEPVKICGCIVSNITAHNYTNVVQNKCGIGSKIKFKRAGLVIPKLEKVLTTSEEYNLPKCKIKIDGVNLILDEKITKTSSKKNEYVFEKNVRALEYFGQKLEIKQLGYGNCLKLYTCYANENNDILEPYNFLNLKDEFIIKTIGENGKKIVSSLKDIKTNLNEIKYATAIGAFGSDIGERILQLVWNKYNTLYPLTKEQLKSIDGFADARINQYLKYQENWNKIKNKSLNFLTFKKEEKEIISNKLKDYVVCFTGIRDKNLVEYITKNGGIASDSWKKNTTHLIVKSKEIESAKMKKAKEINIPILTLEEMYKEVNYDN